MRGEGAKLKAFIQILCTVYCDVLYNLHFRCNTNDTKGQQVGGRKGGWVLCDFFLLQKPTFWLCQYNGDSIIH